MCLRAIPCGGSRVAPCEPTALAAGSGGAKRGPNSPDASAYGSRGCENLNSSVDRMAAAMRSSLTLEAAALVGRSVLVPTDQAERGSGNVYRVRRLPEPRGLVPAYLFPAANR